MRQVTHPDTVRPTASEPPHVLLSLKDGAAYMGVHHRTLRRWISEGRLTGYRVGPTLLRVDRAELDALGIAIPTAGAK